MPQQPSPDHQQPPSFVSNPIIHLKDQLLARHSLRVERSRDTIPASEHTEKLLSVVQGCETKCHIHWRQEDLMIAGSAAPFALSCQHQALIAHDTLGEFLSEYR